jgi:hypothetical protein
MGAMERLDPKHGIQAIRIPASLPWSLYSSFAAAFCQFGLPQIASGGGRAGCDRPIGNCQKSSDIFDSKKSQKSNAENNISNSTIEYSCQSVKTPDN